MRHMYTADVPTTPRRYGMPWPGPATGRDAEDAGCAAFCAGEFADSEAYLTVAEMAAHTRQAGGCELGVHSGPGTASGHHDDPVSQPEDLIQIAVLEDNVLVEHYVSRDSQSSLIAATTTGLFQSGRPDWKASRVNRSKSALSP